MSHMCLKAIVKQQHVHSPDWLCQSHIFNVFCMVIMVIVPGKLKTSLRLLPLPLTRRQKLLACLTNRHELVCTLPGPVLMQQHVSHLSKTRDGVHATWVYDDLTACITPVQDS